MPRININELKSKKNKKISKNGDFFSLISSKLETLKKIKVDRKFMLIALIVLLALVGYFKKEWFVAATVNGMPITNIELLKFMNQQYRSQTLNQLINERIILIEASKKGIYVSNTEVGKKYSDIEKSIGGEQVLGELLSQQGQSKEGLNTQLKLQLVIEKLYDAESTSSAEEVEVFLEKNKDQLQATTSAKQQEEAISLLKQEKLSRIFNEKFQQLKQQADIKIF